MCDMPEYGKIPLRYCSILRMNYNNRVKMKMMMMAEDYFTHTLTLTLKKWNLEFSMWRVFTVYREVKTFRINLPRSSAKHKTLSSGRRIKLVKYQARKQHVINASCNAINFKYKYKKFLTLFIFRTAAVFITLN